MSAFEPCEKCGHMIVRGKPCEICADKKEQQDRIAALESALTKAERERDEANSGLADLEEQIPEDRAEIRKLEMDNATLRAQVAGLRAKVGGLEWLVDGEYCVDCGTHRAFAHHDGCKVKEALARCQPASAADTQPEGRKE